MTFDVPLLLFLAPVLALAYAGLAWIARRRRVRRAAAWSRALARVARADGRWSFAVLGLVALAAFAALAGPRAGRTQVRTETRALSLVIAVDISRSMLAEDAAPNRLRRAVREARRLVQDLEGDRIGLIAFAGRSYILSPLTVDGGAITLLLDALDPEMVSQGGTSVGAALAQGGELLAATGEVADRVLVLFTDGESHDSLDQTLAAARALAKQNVRLVVVGEGGTRPVRIPIRDSAGTLLEYVLDEGGGVVFSSRRDDVLRQIVRAGEGTLVPAALPDQAGAVRDLVSAFKRSPAAETRTADLRPLAWIPLAVAAVVLLAHTLTRRGAALAALALLLPLSGASAQIPSPGARALAEGRPERAAAAFLDEARRGIAPDTAFYNAGTAALRAGEYEVARRALTQAAKTVDPALRYRALYNMGLAALLAAQRDSAGREELLEQAQRHLREALLLEPASERAKWNLELATRRRQPPSGGGGSPPPSGGGGQSQSEPRPGGGEAPAGLTESQAEQILSSVEREERSTRVRRTVRQRGGGGARVKDW